VSEGENEGKNEGENERNEEGKGNVLIVVINK